MKKNYNFLEIVLPKIHQWAKINFELRESVVKKNFATIAMFSRVREDTLIEYLPSTYSIVISLRWNLGRTMPSRHVNFHCTTLCWMVITIRTFIWFITQVNSNMSVNVAFTISKIWASKAYKFITKFVWSRIRSTLSSMIYQLLHTIWLKFFTVNTVIIIWKESKHITVIIDTLLKSN